MLPFETLSVNISMTNCFQIYLISGTPRVSIDKFNLWSLMVVCFMNTSILLPHIDESIIILRSVWGRVFNSTIDMNMLETKTNYVLAIHVW